jgi:hypothetical protein
VLVARALCLTQHARAIMIAMTRRIWLTTFAAMPVVPAVRSLDLVKVLASDSFCVSFYGWPQADRSLHTIARRRLGQAW